MLAGGFKRRMLNKRATTAVASANAAMAVKEPRSCQQAVRHFPQCLVSLIRWVAQVEIENGAVIEDAARIRVCAESPLPVIFPHPGISNAAEWQLMNQRLDRAIVHARIARGCRVEDLLSHAMVRRKYVKSERTWPRADELNDLLNSADLQDRKNRPKDFFLHRRGVEWHIYENRGSDVPFGRVALTAMADRPALEQAPQSLEVMGTDDTTVVRTLPRIFAVKLKSGLLQNFEELTRDILEHENVIGRGARLTRVRPSAVCDAPRCHIKIC